MNPAENYIINQSEPFRSILLHLQWIIESTIPGIELKYKYKIPFYYVDGRPFCYLNKSKSENYVDVGFWNSAHLTVHTELLVTAGRKVMKSIRYTTLEEIEDTILKEVLDDAYQVRYKKFWK
ncbi:DUF1801 domain-containing protein [uncultured Maribacter sp.]|uniref:DUF1801 domain-containing protein n=1 Tax=uncultured Maribacter sp. TaxID=431308 RepID=UPI002615812B|nr:DUF1801 domain-containing protein [uncultured Maribacter sp.]